jgi:hypothetical protein
LRVLMREDESVLAKIHLVTQGCQEYL